MRLLVVAALMLSAPAALATTDLPTTAVVGHVALAAPEPQCTPAGCSTPARFLGIRLRRTTGAVKVVRTDKTGTFRTRLAPGTYTVSTALTEQDMSAAIVPARVIVRRRALQTFRFVYRPGR